MDRRRSTMSKKSCDMRFRVASMGRGIHKIHAIETMGIILSQKLKK